MLQPIPCNIFVVSYTEEWRGVKTEYTIITKNNNMKEVIRKAQANEYDPDSVKMFRQQYLNLFAPLFKQIKELNEQILKIQKE